MFALSKLVPVPMRSIYGTVDGRERATWWQWRGRIWRHRREALVR